MALFELPKPKHTAHAFSRAIKGEHNYGAGERWLTAEGFVRDEKGRLSTTDRDFTNLYDDTADLTFHRCDWTGSKLGLTDRAIAVDTLFVDLFPSSSLYGFAENEFERCFFDLAHFGTLTDNRIERCCFFRAKRPFSFERGEQTVQAESTRCNWYGTTLRSCSLEEADLPGDALAEMLVEDTRFCGARLRKHVRTHDRYGELRKEPRVLHAETEKSHFLRCDFSYTDVDECKMADTVFEHCIFDHVEGTPFVDKSTILIAPHCRGPAPAWFSRCTVVWPGRASSDELERVVQAGIVQLTKEAAFPAWWAALPYPLLREHRAWWAQEESERDPSDPRRLVLDGADLREAIVPTGTFSGAILRNCNLAGAMVGRCQELEASDCNFEGAQLSALYRSQLTRCTFRRATMVVAYFDHSTIVECAFDDMIGRISFRDATLTDCSLDRADVVCLEFLRSSLTRCSLREMRLSDGVDNFCFSRIQLSEVIDCNFSDSDFGNKTAIEGSIFTRCNFSQVQTRVVWMTPKGKRYPVLDVRIGNHEEEATETILIDPVATDGDPEWFSKCKVIRHAAASSG